MHHIRIETRPIIGSLYRVESEERVVVATNYGTLKKVVQKEGGFNLSKSINDLINKIYNVIDGVLLRINPTKERIVRAEKNLVTRKSELSEKAVVLKGEIKCLDLEQEKQDQVSEGLHQELAPLLLSEIRLKKNIDLLKEAIENEEENIAENIADKKKIGYSPLGTLDQLDDPKNELKNNTSELNKVLCRQEEIFNLFKTIPLFSHFEAKKLAMKSELDQIEHKLNDTNRDLNKIKKYKFNIGMLSDEFALNARELKNEIKKLNSLVQEYKKVSASKALKENTSLPEFKRFLSQVTFIKFEIVKMSKYINDLKSSFQKIHHKDPELATKIASAERKIDSLRERLNSAKLEFREIELLNLIKLKTEIINGWRDLVDAEMMAEFPDDPNAEIASQLKLSPIDVANNDKDLLAVQQKIYNIYQKAREAKIEKIESKMKSTVNELNAKFGEMIMNFEEEGMEIFDETKRSYMAWRDKPYDLRLLNKLSDQISIEEDKSLDETGEIKNYFEPLRKLIIDYDFLTKAKV